LLGDAATRLTFSETTMLVFIVDELGSSPTMLRAMISTLDTMKERLRQLFKVGSVRIVACGTGTDTVNTAPGSFPGNYMLFSLNDATAGEDPIGLQLLKNKAAKKHVCATLANLIQASKAHIAVLLRDALHNARFAALLMEHAEDVKEYPASLGLLQALFAHTVVAYRGRNAIDPIDASELSSCGESELRSAVQSALGIVLSETRRTLTQDELSLIHRLGILTDRARFKQHSPSSDASWSPVLDAHGKPTVEAHDNMTMTLCAPTDHRYVMSRAQCAMARFYYGSCWSSGWTASGDGFEATVDDFLLVCLLAAGDKATTDLSCEMGRLGAGDARGAAHVKRWLFECRATDVHMAAATYEVAPSSKSSALVIQRVATLVAGGSAVVLRNRARSAFADTIVACPGHLLLVQSKQYANSDLAPYQIAAEMHKLGDTSPTALAGYLAKSVSRASLQKNKLAQKYAPTQNVKREQLFQDLCNGLHPKLDSALRDGERDAPSQFVKTMCDELCKTSHDRAVQVRRVLIMASEQNNMDVGAAHSVLTGDAALVHVPSSKYDVALYPIVIPRDPSTAGKTPNAVELDSAIVVSRVLPKWCGSPTKPNPTRKQSP
jgi:hypothetical protein